MTLPILIFLGFGSVIVAVIWFSYQAEKKRTLALEQLASELGFEFQPDGEVEMFRDRSRFHLFSLGRSPRTSNVLHGRSHDLEVVLFDFQYVTGSGKSRKTWRQTVAGIQFDGPPLPAFTLRPENLFHKIGAWFGWSDINFDSHPAFSRHYLLRGENEAAVRQRFTDAVLDWYQEHPGLGTEAVGPRLLFYRQNQRVEPAELRGFLEDAFQALVRLRGDG